MVIVAALLTLLMTLVFAAPQQSYAGGPQPGDLYREFATHNGGDRDWRVTDKNAVIKFERAKAHLPNARVEIRIDDLEHAVRAEAMLDRWGGHRGTINKRIRFNDNPWITVPELENVPAGIRPEHLFFQDNPVVDVPLEDLREGINVFDADCDEQDGFGWGQWGLYSMVVRVYYDNERKDEGHRIAGRITTPQSGTILGEDPSIRIDATATMGVSRIDVLASYDGYDEDGDGDFGGYHESHFQLVRGEANEIRDHVGTLWGKPYELTWRTGWVPDQDPEAIAIVARIQDSRGYWFVTEPVERLSLERQDFSVKLYPAIGVPEDFGVRAGATKSCTFHIPDSDSIASATDALLHLRTWHGWDGHHDPIRINDYELPVDGKNHFYDYDRLTFPVSALKQGDNTFTIHSDTEHHMLEVLWPGPAITLRFARPKIDPQADLDIEVETDVVAEIDPEPSVNIRDDQYEQRPHFVIDTPRASYWLDKNSGGLSRLIDRDGNDWIAFKKEPWDQYPASAASAFRGLPNLLFGGEESGFGHPGWDQATSRQVDACTIESTSKSGKWRLRWTFFDTDVELQIETDDHERPFWFLYEGPIAGRWDPDAQYFATDQSTPDTKPHDYIAGDRIYRPFRWAYVGDRSTPRVLAIVHRTPDQAIDTFAHLGNTKQGLNSDDGMVVLGFGRGSKGIEPLLKGAQSFRIRLVESAGLTDAEYQSISTQLDAW